jgi:hypothetical protein
MSREYPSHVVVPLIPSNGGKPFIPCDDDEEEDNNEEMDERENGGLTAR